MAKLSPLQRVREEHTSKQELAKKVLEFLEVPEGESKSDFEYRISHLSNTKLLRLWDNQRLLQEKYESRTALIEKLVKKKFPNGNEDYSRKLESFTTNKLLDLARQLKV